MRGGGGEGVTGGIGAVGGNCRSGGGGGSVGVSGTGVLCLWLCLVQGEGDLHWQREE